MNTKPNTTLYIVLSILEFFCCCQIMGIAGFVLSLIANSDAGKGDYAGAEEKLKNAKICLIIGAVVGFIVEGLYILIYGAAIFSQM